MNGRTFSIDTAARESLLRIVGALLFASGAAILFIRKNEADAWGEFVQLLVLLIPCVLLYFLGLGLLRPEPAEAHVETRTGEAPLARP